LIWGIFDNNCDFFVVMVCRALLPVLQKIVKIGTPRQAKHGVRCLHAICQSPAKVLDSIFGQLKKNMELDSPNFLSSLVAIGHMTQLCPAEFAPAVKNIVSRFIVKELLMKDRVRFNVAFQTKKL
jgi:sister-chromatid-cohesion protein PDS5